MYSGMWASRCRRPRRNTSILQELFHDMEVPICKVGLRLDHQSNLIQKSFMTAQVLVGIQSRPASSDETIQLYRQTNQGTTTGCLTLLKILKIYCNYFSSCKSTKSPGNCLAEFVTQNSCISQRTSRKHLTVNEN